MARQHRRFGCVCASNQNRSMEAHQLLQEHGFNVKSFGTGTLVRLPGPSADRPNVYSFQTPYSKIYNELKQQNEDLYTQNGVLNMLARNQKLKLAPERFQDSKDEFDIIVTFEERVFEAVLEHFNTNPSQSFQITYVINVETSDTHSDAAVGARNTLELAEVLDNLKDLDEEIAFALDQYERREHRSILFSVQFF